MDLDIPQLVEWLPCTPKTLGSKSWPWLPFPVLHKADMRAHSCNPSSWEGKVGRWKRKMILSYKVSLGPDWNTTDSISKKIHLYLYLYISINTLWYKHKTQPRLASSSWEGWKEELWLLTFWLAVPEFCPLFKFVRRPVILCLQIAL